MVVFGIAEKALVTYAAGYRQRLGSRSSAWPLQRSVCARLDHRILHRPAIAGFALDANAGPALLIALIGGWLLAAAWATRLGRQLPESANTIAA
jgi:hypothetical protein